MGLGVGVSLNNAKAVIEAIISAIKRKPSEFVRTPKYGVTGMSKTTWRPQSVLTLKNLTLPIIEIAFGCYMFGCLLISVYYQYGRMSDPFLAVFAGGYFYVGFTSLYALWKMSRDSEEIEAPEAEPAEVIST
jgi:hypothetical protein